MGIRRWDPGIYTWVPFYMRVYSFMKIVLRLSAIPAILGLVFVLAKIFGQMPVAGWSWWLVLLPFYGPYLLLLGVILGITGILIFIDALKELFTPAWKKKI